MASRPADPALAAVLSAAGVRERCQALLAAAESGELDGFEVDLAALDGIAGDVADLTRTRYPDLQVPLHSRWRHFEFQGHDLWQEAAAGLDPTQTLEASVDLAVVSVLLDAGAGSTWRYHDTTTGLALGRSEGLALASLRLFLSGTFSSDPHRPWQVDAPALRALRADRFAEALQISDDNAMPGIEGRVALLRRLGAVLAADPDRFGSVTPRPAGLARVLADAAGPDGLPAPRILEELLDGLGGIWPGRLSVDGLPLGDCWHHEALRRPDVSDGLLPLHKLSQWLSYSLVEPLRTAGIPVLDLDGLTGLAEYRNGGLFLDGGVLCLRDPGAAARQHSVNSPLVVEWRGLTVALLDRLAPMVRDRLEAPDLPLASILEGGTWAAGRALAAERRDDGGPPLRIESDGTVF